MRYFLLCAFAMLSLPAHAADGRIPDLSMTPQEMLQQNMNINKPGVPLGGSNLTPTLPGQNPWGGVQAPVVGAPEGQPANSYMAGYCDPNFRPLLGNNPQYASMAACLQQQREEACRLYAAVPVDARKALDDTINCTAMAMEGAGFGEDDGFGSAPSPMAMMAACNGTDTRRLALVKQYWQDESTAYALVFVPDLVMDSSGSCLNKR